MKKSRFSKKQRGQELSAIDEIANNVAAFSDDGRGVQNDEIMRKAMTKIKEYNKIIAAHCEDNSLLKAGYIHDGEYAKLHNHFERLFHHQRKQQHYLLFHQ